MGENNKKIEHLCEPLCLLTAPDVNTTFLFCCIGFCLKKAIANYPLSTKHHRCLIFDRLSTLNTAKAKVK